MRWTDPSEDRLSPEGIVALIRQIASDEPIDTATAAVCRLEAHVRQIVRVEVALAAQPSEKLAQVVSEELSNLTREVERGLYEVNLSVMRKRPSH